MRKVKLVSVISYLLVMVILFLFANSFTKEAAAEVKTLKIGLITSMTGPAAPAFKPMSEAIKPTEDLMNQRGGVTVEGQKYNIQIIAEDDQSSPPGAVAAANKLIQAGIKFIIPPLFTPSTLAVIPITEEAKVLCIKSLGTLREQANPNLRYSFGVSTFVYNPPVAYDYLKKNYPKVKKVAIISPDDPAGKTYTELAEKEIQRHGLEIVFQEAFKIGSEDFYPILTKALGKKPDAIDVVFSIEPWSAGIINQSRELGFTGPIYASVALLGDINILKGMLNPEYTHNLFQMGPDVHSPKMPSIVKEYRVLLERQVKTPLNTAHIAVLDAVLVLVQGIGKAQSIDTDKVAQALESMKNIDTAYGRGRMAGEEFFGINHVIRRPIAVSGLMNGKVFSEFLNRD
jgi:branched-chain amino acid transport system substrate-binding protein